MDIMLHNNNYHLFIALEGINYCNKLLKYKNKLY